MNNSLCVTSITLKLQMGQNEPGISKRSKDEIGITVGTSADLGAIFAETEKFFSKIDPSIQMPIRFNVKRIKFKGEFNDFGLRIYISIHLKKNLLEKGFKPDLVISNCKLGEAELAELRKLALDYSLKLIEVTKTKKDLLMRKDYSKIKLLINKGYLHHIPQEL